MMHDGARVVHPTGVTLLEGLTKLAKSVQGILETSDDGSITRFSTSSNPGGKIIALPLSSGSRCVKRYMVIDGNDLMGEGQIVNGIAHLKGSFVKNGSKTIGIVGENLISFESSDTSEDCPHSLTSHTIPYGVQTSLMPLAPVVEYASSVWSGQIKRAIVACVNGVFVLQTATASVDPSIASAVLENLLALKYVIDARDDGTKGGVICRISTNAVAVLNSREMIGDVINVQKKLGVSVYKDIEKILLTTGNFVISASILDISSEVETDSTDLKRASLVLGSSTKVLEQPLSSWQTPPLTLKVLIHVSASAVSKTYYPSESISEKFLLHGGTLGVIVNGSHPALRFLKPGESPGELEKQLSRVIIAVLTESIAKLPGGNRSQDSLDESTKQTAETMRERITASGLLAAPCFVQMSVSQSKSNGRRLKLPSGLTCIIPDYALDANEPRLALILGALPSLGAVATFTKWSTAELSGVAVGW
jgi:hypothetical protein